MRALLLAALLLLASPAHARTQWHDLSLDQRFWSTGLVLVILPFGIGFGTSVKVQANNPHMMDEPQHVYSVGMGPYGAQIVNDEWGPSMFSHRWGEGVGPWMRRNRIREVPGLLVNEPHVGKTALELADECGDNACTDGEVE